MNDDVPPVRRELLEKLAGDLLNRSAPPNGHAGNGHAGGVQRKLKVEAYLAHYGREVLGTKRLADARTAYLIRCPFDGSHGGHTETAIYQDGQGKLGAKCMHASCQGRKWKEFKAAIGKPLPEHFETAAGGQPTKQGEQDGHAIILDYFWQEYQPSFRRGEAIRSEKLGRDVKRSEACSAPDKALIGRLMEAKDAPRRSDGTIDPRTLIKFFYDWAPVAWKDLLKDLEEEAKAAEVSATGAEDLKRQIAHALHHQVTVGVSSYVGNEQVTHKEQRSLIEWCCQKEFCLYQKWTGVRDYRIWVMKERDDRIRVAIHAELFHQLGIRSLNDVDAETFNDLCERYEVGQRMRMSRCRAVELSTAFLAVHMKASPWGKSGPPANDSSGPNDSPVIGAVIPQVQEEGGDEGANDSMTG